MPDWRLELRRRLAPLRLSPVREAEVVEELSQHLEGRFNDLVARGIGAGEARRIALDEISGRELARELSGVLPPAQPAALPPGGSGGEGRFGRFRKDLRFGVRILRTRPGFTIVAVLTLALGIGANTAIFSTVNGVLLRPLPYAESENLVTFWGTAPEKRLLVVNYPDAMFVSFHQRTRVFESVAAYTVGGASLSGDGDPERVQASGVSADFFTVMKQVAVAGRGFLPEDGTRGQNNVAVLSHALRRRRFGGDTGLVGKPIQLGGQPT